MILPSWSRRILLGFGLFLLATSSLAQVRASRNMELVANVALGGQNALSAVLLDQHPDRPLAYAIGALGLHVVSTEDGERLASVRLDADGWSDLASFPVGNRTFVAAVGRHGLLLWNVTDPGNPEEIRRLGPEAAGHALFAYKAADGRALLFVAGAGVTIHDISGLVSGTGADMASLSLPDAVAGEIRDVYVAWHDETESERVYLAGRGGYAVLDLATGATVALVSDAGVQLGTSISATPDGTHLITTANYRTAPVRIYDIRPVLDGTISQVRTPVGAWTADWRHHAERHTVRWPFFFVAAHDDGLHVVNMRNAFEPYTEGFFRTWDGPVSKPGEPYNGARDVDVRNHDGLIAVADAHTGLYLIRMEGFQGWDGRGWGLPNVGHVQDWENGPVGQTRWQP
jgi:hypothetical protein